MGITDWLHFGPEFIIAILAVWALIKASRKEHDDTALAPLIGQMTRFERALDQHAASTNSFRDEVRSRFDKVTDEFRVTREQVTGAQHEALIVFARKDEVRDTVSDLRSEINMAGRVTALERRSARS